MNRSHFGKRQRHISETKILGLLHEWPYHLLPELVLSSLAWEICGDLRALPGEVRVWGEEGAQERCDISFISISPRL